MCEEKYMREEGGRRGRRGGEKEVVSYPDPTPLREGSGDIGAFSWLCCVSSHVTLITRSNCSSLTMKTQVAFSNFYVNIDLGNLSQLRMHLSTVHESRSVVTNDAST